MKLFFSLIVSIGVLIAGGFVFSAGTEPGTTQLSLPPTNTIIPPSTETTTAPTIPPTAIMTSPIATATPGVCDRYALEADEDNEFLTFLKENTIVERNSSLVERCEKIAAIDPNLLIVKHENPGSKEFRQARDYLISATTHCQAPDSASKSRTRDDLSKATGFLKAFDDAQIACQTSGMGMVTQFTPALTVSTSGVNSDSSQSVSITRAGTGDDVQ